MRLPSALQRFDTTNLRLRVMSSIIIAPLTLIAVFWGSFAYGAAVICAVTIGLYEWLRIVAPQAPNQTVAIATGMMVSLTMAAGLVSIPAGAVVGAVCTIVLYLISLLRDHDERACLIAFGIPYMGISALAFLALRTTPQIGRDLVLFLLAVVWSTDIGAYIVGRTLGGAKLAPLISPSKTWAGLVGGMISAAIAGYLTAPLVSAKAPGVMIVLSILMAIVAQLGDLFESYFKRRSGVKESGDLIPGHGGILDRIDGLVFAAIFLFIFQSTLGKMITWW